MPLTRRQALAGAAAMSALIAMPGLSYAASRPAFTHGLRPRPAPTACDQATSPITAL
jgi:hypothetical protein